MQANLNFDGEDGTLYSAEGTVRHDFGGSPKHLIVRVWPKIPFKDADEADNIAAAYFEYSKKVGSFFDQPRPEATLVLRAPCLVVRLAEPIRTFAINKNLNPQVAEVFELGGINEVETRNIVRGFWKNLGATFTPEISQRFGISAP
jgi:hypothetical protein